MDKVAPEGQRLPPRSSKDGGTSTTLGRGVGPSAIAQRLLLTPLSLCKFCFALIWATTNLDCTVSSSATFSVQSTKYKCGSNMICLGQAHEYTGNDTTGMHVGRLSLMYEPPHAESNIGAGLAYYSEPVRFLDPINNRSASFSTNLSIEVVLLGYPSQGDRMAFVISANNDTLGSEREFLGNFHEEGITTEKYVVVEFDGYQDVEPAIHINSNNVSFDFDNITTPAAAEASDVGVQVCYNLTTYAWVEYSNKTQQLEVRISKKSSRPIQPLVNYTVDLFDVVEEYMWVGFSARSGNCFSNYYVGDWNFESYGISPSSPALTKNLTKNKFNKLGVIVGISVCGPALVLACIIIIVFVRRSEARSGYRRCNLGWPLFMEKDSITIEGMPERFSYKQLSVATGGFGEKSKLGQGAFGSVYRGVLPTSGISVAVKKISSDSTQGETEFMTEVSIISQLRHRNMIQLLGWCKETFKGNFLLVYDLMPNGSLDKALFKPAEDGRARLSWPQRLNIVTGIAVALDYLHQGWKQQVIHRDIKSSNILLDDEWNARLGDFGLARLVDHERTIPTTMVAGTFGYLAPELTASGRFTEKTDVFAFGVVVLEVACGRKALAADVPEDEMVLVDWVWSRHFEGDLLMTVDKRLRDYDTHWMEVVLTVGLLCCHRNPLARPSMRHVVQVLAGDLPLMSCIPASSFGFPSSSVTHGISMDGSTRRSSGKYSLFKSKSVSLALTKLSDSARDIADGEEVV